MIEITAKLADGWIPEAHTPETYRTTLEKIFAQRKKEGKKLEGFEPCLAVVYYSFELDENAYKRILSASKHYLATYPDILWSAGYGANHPGLRTQQLMSKPDLWNQLAEKVPDKLADSAIIYGTPSECIEEIAEFREAGCHHIIFEPYWIEKDRMKEALEIAGRKIKPEIESL